MSKKILVIGGTGMLGYPVAQDLKTGGHAVSIVTREPYQAEKKFGKDIDFLEGDVRSVSSLRKIIRGFEGVHINLSSNSFKELDEIEVKGTANVAKTASEAGIKKITMISGLGVMEKNAWSPFVRAKLDSEKALKMSGLPYTIFNCTHFMESIPSYIRNKKAMIIGLQKHPYHWVSARDYARMVTRSFDEKQSDFKNVPVLGPEALTMETAFTTYAQLQDDDISVSHVSLGKLSWIAMLTFNSHLKFILSMMKYFEKTPELLTREDMPGYLEKPSTTLKEWIKDKQESSVNPKNS